MKIKLTNLIGFFVFIVSSVANSVLIISDSTLRLNNPTSGQIITIFSLLFMFLGLGILLGGYLSGMDTNE